jgi:argininosuccinate lyase
MGLYRGRLRRGPSPDALAYASSLEEDLRLWDEELEAVRAHVVMLGEAGLITREEAAAVIKALAELKRPTRPLRRYEDVHELVEARVIKKAGEAGERLYTARSRNDQVATITRMWCRARLLELASGCIGFAELLLRRAREHAGIAMPYYTHRRQAQIGSLGHYWLANAEAIARDIERALEAYARCNLSPLGAGPCAGSSLPIDRRRAARLLGFEGLVENSLDAVTSRDFALDALHSCVCLMVDLSRLAEDLIFFSSEEVALLELPEQLSFSSSIMPQKKNPDVLELVRARAARVLSLYAGLASTLKGLPSGYNRELQEVKPTLLEGFSLTLRSLSALKPLVKRIRPDAKRAKELARRSSALALEAVEWLTLRAGLPWREAYKKVAMMARELAKRHRAWGELTEQELAGLLEGADLDGSMAAELRRRLGPDLALRLRRSLGSPNPEELREACARSEARLMALLRQVEARRKALELARLELEDAARRIGSAH